MNYEMLRMISDVDAFLDYAALHPVLPPFFFCFTSLCSIPIIILFIATQKCALHLNCRYLISFWCVSLLGVLVNIVMLNTATMNYEKYGYIPRGILEPPLRPPFLAVHSMVYASSSCFEMFIAFERILSAMKPDSYHESSAYWRMLISLTIFAYTLGTCIGYTIYIAGHHILGVIIYNVIDISTLVINTFGIRYCKARYLQLYGNGSLNARYQVYEAYEMAKAMHPVYWISFCLKGIAIIIAYVYFLLMDFFNGSLYALMDFGYFTAHAFNCAFSSAVLMYLHKSLRKSTLTLLGLKKLTYLVQN
ncbi:hypothetical protein PRIPAC_88816 [Pristionchus pacificus]|uniref:Uncharacterized protein n=1 Tax=Pristionchus pacificus TaxID=54126 RepID=A0A2A6B7K1_PRIPA|nr:hypothetical protein PRIPAC_88816 [Pristionchus pacificus]|eukprot:PDM61860.1 hypothetical protein PRIPAC_51302 [Pristionchus pacificus]